MGILILIFIVIVSITSYENVLTAYNKTIKNMFTCYMCIKYKGIVTKPYPTTNMNINPIFSHVVLGQHSGCPLHFGTSA